MCVACFEHFFASLERDTAIVDDEPHAHSLVKLHRFLQPPCPFRGAAHSVVDILRWLPFTQQQIMRKGMRMQLVKWFMKEGVLHLAAMRRTVIQTKERLIQMAGALVPPSSLMFLRQDASAFLQLAGELQSMGTIMLETCAFAHAYEANYIYERKCSVVECTGTLDSVNMTCTKCGSVECANCGMTHGKREACNLPDIESRRAVAQETKPCPMCASPIFKEAGCNDMYCTLCQTGFNWRTGRMIVGDFHNPHKPELPQNDEDGAVEGWSTFLADVHRILSELAAPLNECGTGRAQLEMLKRDWIEACALSNEQDFFHIAATSDMVISEDARMVLDRFIRATMSRQQFAAILSGILGPDNKANEICRSRLMAVLAKASRSSGGLVKLDFSEAALPRLWVRRTFSFWSAAD